MTRSVPTRPTVAAVAAMLLIGAALAGCTGEEAVPTEAIGTVLPALGAPEGDPLDVRVPTGRLIVTIGQPQESVPTVDRRVGVEGDGAWIGVSWQSDTQGMPRVMRSGEGEFPLAHLTLVAGEERSPLDDVALVDVTGEPLEAGSEQATGPLGVDGGAWIAVAGARPGGVVADLALEVEFDGVTQRFDPAAREAVPAAGTVAQSLYGQPDALAQAPRACAAAQVPGAAGRGVRLAPEDASCGLAVARAPWLVDRGWVSDPAQRWLVVDTTVFPAPVVSVGERDCGVYDLTDLRASLEGRPLILVSRDTDPGRVRLVAEVEGEGERTLLLTAQQELRSGGAPDGACPTSLPLRWSAVV
ncbi:hypothetical protein [Nocardioides sp.]|uniref:hypothetical protein n=1 Tax=Nocardioides sp. TaxID=35761 RepID=UPI0035185621